MPRLHVTKLTSIGAVEAGDNDPARILFWKRAVTAEERERLAAKGQALPDGSFPIDNVGDLRKAVSAAEMAKNQAAAKRHIIRQARRLGRIDMLPEGWISKHTNPARVGSKGRDMGLDLSHLDDKDAEVIQKHVDALEATIDELEAAVPVVEDEKLPDDLPDAVAKRLAVQDEAIAKAEARAVKAEADTAAVQDERLTERYAERAGELQVLLGEPDKMAPVLKALAAGAPEAFATLDGQFDTLLNLSSMDALLKEYGDNAASGSAVDQIAAYAAEIRKTETGVTMAAAKAQAWRDHPELKDQAREEGD